MSISDDNITTDMNVPVRPNVALFYDLCIIVSFPEENDSSFDTDCNVFSKPKHFLRITLRRNSSSYIGVSGIKKRLLFWNTGCNFNGYYDITPIERVGDDNVRTMKSDLTRELPQEQTAQLSKMNTSCTLKRKHSENNISEGSKRSQFEMYDEYYRKSDDLQGKPAVSETIFNPFKKSNIITELCNRQLHGTTKYFMPPEVFSRMKLYPCRFTDKVTRIKFAKIDHNCKNVIIASECDDVQIWNLQTFKCSILTIPIPIFEQVDQMIMNPNGRLLVVSTTFGRIIGYDYELKQINFIRRNHRSSITSIKFAPKIYNGVSWLGTLCEEHTLSLWPISKMESSNSKPHDYPMLESDSDSNNENSDADNEINVHSVPAASKIFKERSIVCFDFSYTGQYVVFGRKNPYIQIYDLHNSDLIPQLKYEKLSGQINIVYIKWANTRNQFVSCQKNGCAVLWDIKTMSKRRICLTELVPDWPQVAEWSCDDQWLFTIGKNRTVCVWLPDLQSLLYKFETHDRILSLIPNPIHPHVLGGILRNGFLELWNIAGYTNNLQLDTFDIDFNSGKDARYCNAAWSVNGTMLAATNINDKLSLFSLSHGTERIRIPYRTVASKVETNKITYTQKDKCLVQQPPSLYVELDNSDPERLLSSKLFVSR